MRKTVYILGFLITGLISEKVTAQKSANTVMDIRVEVVQGLQTTTSTNDIVFHDEIHSDSKNLTYGTMEMQISDNADYITSFASKIRLLNENGEMLDLDSSTIVTMIDSNRILIKMSGKLNSDPTASGVYLGSQVARIDFY